MGCAISLAHYQVLGTIANILVGRELWAALANRQALCMNAPLPNQARQVLSQAVELDGQCREAVDGMVQLLIKEAKWDEAIHMYGGPPGREEEQTGGEGSS
jgi:hypothetical protein